MNNNLIAWYSEKFEKDNRRVGKLYSKYIPPIEMPYDYLSECVHKLSVNDMVNDVRVNGNTLQNFLIEGGVLVNVLYVDTHLTDKNSIGLELASRSVPALFMAASRMGLPIPRLEERFL